MPQNRTTFQGLGTDSPPDQLADQAFRIQNMMPVSPATVGPRAPTVTVTHYQPLSIGRCIIADALPGDAGNGILLTCINVESTGEGTGDVTQTVKVVAAFRPARIASDYDAVVGFSLATSMFGTIIV